MQHQQNETRAGGKDPQPIPGQPTPDRQKPEMPEMPDKEVPEMPVRQTEDPSQAPVTSGQQQRTREDDPAQEQQRPIK